MATASDQPFDSSGGDAYTDEVVQPGSVLAGKYQVERVLGEGGMGVVVAAQHLQLGQTVALKFLHREALQNAVVTERFLREARAVVKLKSEHVGRVIDVGTLDTGAPYIVMEYLDGCDVQQFLAQHGTLPVVQAVDFVLQACEAIAEAHALGIIHRDLKPANLFLTARADGVPLVKVLDFGISKATGEAEDFSLTRTATVMGSPGYMSPEQLRSAKDVDVRTDVWAVGIILYELVTGKPPFEAETITELTLKVAMDPMPPMLGVVPEFAAVVAKCLAKNAPDRYGSIAELAAALVPFGPPGAHQQAMRIARVQSGHSLSRVKSAVVPAAASVPTTLSAVAATGAGTVPPAPTPRRMGVVIGAAAAVAAAVIAAVIVLSGSKGGNASRGDGATAQPPPVEGSGSATGSAAPSTGSGAQAVEPPVAGQGSGSASGAGVVPPAAGSGSGSGSGSDAVLAPGSAAVIAPGSGSGSATEPATGSGSGSSRKGRGHRRGSGSGSGDEDFSNSRH